MKSNHYSALRIFAGIATILVAILHEHLPQKSLVLYPNPNMKHVLFGSTTDDDEIATSWVNEQQEEWRCQFESKENFFCGYSLYFPSAFDDFDNGIDLSTYAGINVELNARREFACSFAITTRITQITVPGTARSSCRSMQRHPISRKTPTSA